jgi:MFS family permease
MFYGFAFMSTKAVITLFYKEALNLNYSSVAFYENGFNILAIVLLPIFGKILGKTDPRRFVMLTYASLALYLFFIGFTQYFPFYVELWEIQVYYFLLLAIVFKGIFASTMALSWSIGSSYFCSDEEAGDYQSVHLTLTGMRAIFAPLIGVMFYQLIQFSGTFAVAIFSLLAAILLMRWSYKNRALHKPAHTSA